MKEEPKDIPEDLNIPISIFTDRSLASLEVVVEYLKEVKNLSYHQIAVLLNRNDRTIWTCYNRAKAKRKLTDKSGNSQIDKKRANKK